MKKILILLAFIGMAFTGCNPVEDINNDIDSEVVVGIEEFTMTTEDYENIVEQGEDDDPDYYETFEAFSDVDDAKAMLPGFLSNRYPFWGEGSSVAVNFNLFDGNPENASDFTNSDVYELSNADYASTGDAFGFYPDVDASDEIPAVLDAQIASPTDGQLVLVKYDQYFEVPEIGLAPLYNAEFPADYDSFELVSVSGPDALGWTVGAANVQGSGFSGGAVATEEWLISPEIDLTGESDLLFQITQEIDFLNDEDLIDVMVSTDYTTGGDVMAATWTAFAFDKTIYGSLTASEDFDFSAYDGQQIHIGLKYSSTDSDSPRWRVQSLAVKAIGISGDTNAKGEYFVYEDGSWEAAEDVHYLSAADYDSMGENSGQPGRFDNFSNSTSPSDYLPQFLSIQNPFAQEEDEIFIVYRFFRGGAVGTTTRGNLYTFTNGEWIQSTTSLKLGYKNGVWVPDNTIRYTLNSTDYSLVVDELTGIEGFEAAVDNLDSFGNFNRTGPWTDDMIVTALNVVLDNLDPSAEEGQKYIVTIATWAPGNSTEDFALIKDTGEWRLQTDED